MINSDILQDVALVSGGYVQRSGNRTGASVEFNVRSGSRERPAGAHGGQRHGRVARGRRAAAWQARIVAGLGASELSRSRDRPAGRRSGAVWFLGRADEVRLRPQPLAARSDDGRGRPFPARGAQRGDRRERSLRRVECVGSRHRDLAMVGKPKRSERGRHGRHQPVSQRDASWHRPRQRARTAVERPRRRAAPVDAEHRARGWGRSWRSFANRAGVSVLSLRRPTASSTTIQAMQHGPGPTRRPAGASGRGSHCCPACERIIRTLTDDSTVSPWLQAVWRVSASTTVRGATGLYQQFPGFEQVIGAWGTPGLSAERATEFDVGVEQAIGRSARVQVTLYDREDNDFLRRAGAEPRVVNGRLVPGLEDRPLRKPRGRAPREASR